LKEQPKAVQAAMEFLKEALKNGPRLVKELEAEARKQGISQMTLRRARVALEVRKYHEVVPGPWWVGLAEAEGTRSQESGVNGRTPVDHVDHVGENAGKLNEKSEDPVEHVEEIAAQNGVGALAQPREGRPFSPGAQEEKGAAIALLEAGEVRHEMTIDCESADHVEHVGEVTGDLADNAADHVEQDELLREMLAVSEWRNMPEDSLLRELGGGDPHEPGGFAKMSIFGRNESAENGRPKSKRKRRAK
jgi:hypothetical protein